MRGKKGTKTAINQVIKSTASMGKFNPDHHTIKRKKSKK